MNRNKNKRRRVEHEHGWTCEKLYVIQRPLNNAMHNNNSRHPNETNVDREPSMCIAAAIHMCIVFIYK